MKKILFYFFILISINTFSKDFNNAFESYGDIMQIVLPVSAFSWTIYKKDFDGTIQFGKSFLSAQGATILLKNIIKEKRPDGGKQSFPSGHTMAAFVGATFLDLRYNSQYKPWFYSAATMVGLSRIISERHWTHDVIGGAFLGIYSTKIFTRQIQGRISIMPIILPNSIIIASKF